MNIESQKNNPKNWITNTVVLLATLFPLTDVKSALAAKKQAGAGRLGGVEQQLNPEHQQNLNRLFGPTTPLQPNSSTYNEEFTTTRNNEAKYP